MSSLPRASAGVRARIADIRDRVRTSEANAPAPPNETSPPCRSTGTTKNYNSQKLKTGKTPCDKDTGITGETQSYAMGGRVKRTGSAKLHKDEVVLPVALVKQLNKLLKK